MLSFEFHVDPALNERTLACLARLESLGQYEANVSRQEVPAFVGEWLASRAFASHFAQTIAPDPAFDYGEIFVRYPR